MSDKELIKALRQMGVQTGGLMCVGCGHEHNCGINGCAVIQAAADALEAQAAEIERYETAFDRLGEFGRLFMDYTEIPVALWAGCVDRWKKRSFT